MKRFKIIVAYDGTDYRGWQHQPNERTVEQTLKESFREVFKKDLRFLGASRTDAGVHALGQAVRVQADITLPLERLVTVWNGGLPKDIIIRSAHDIDDHFHPHRNVEQKTYWYHVSFNRLLPFLNRYVWYFRYPVDHKKLEECLQLFVGTHDFAAFATEPGDKDTVRRIDVLSVSYLKRYNIYRIEVKGPSFLQYMIRRIVGACLTVASRDNLTVESLKKILEEKNPEHALPKAAARGLCLYKVRYAKQVNL